jgi:hypothetical protein
VRSTSGADQAIADSGHRSQRSEEASPQRLAHEMSLERGFALRDQRDLFPHRRRGIGSEPVLASHVVDAPVPRAWVPSRAV